MKTKSVIIIAICISIIAIAIYYLPLYFRNKEISELKEQSMVLVQKIEDYKKRNHRLPDSLEDLKLNLPDDYQIYYDMGRDSMTYTVSFQVLPFRSMYYNSETKQWQLQSD